MVDVIDATRVPRFDADTLANPDKELRSVFDQYGVLLVEGFLEADDCIQMRAEAERLVARADLPADPSVFSTVSQTHASQDYFLGSSNGVRFFFEEDAFDVQGNLTVPVGRAINKIGHALHDQNELFNRFSRDPRLATICAALGRHAPKLVQSMYIFKQPHVGGEVVWHQDSTFLHTVPLSVLGFWFALEDAGKANGCLWALPGAHKLGLKERWKVSDNGMTFESLRQIEWPIEQALPLEVPGGTLVVLHGELPHWSAPNRTARSRHAYTLHVVDGEATYSQDNWLQRPEDDPFRGF